MELEELMANRALLKKMSAQDEIPLRVLRKSPRAPNRNIDSSEVRNMTPNRNMQNLNVSKPSLNTSNLNNQNRPGIKTDDCVPPPVVFVPEGYGCKIPKSLRRCTQVIKILFLLLYIFGMPVILYQLHTNLQHTKRRIRSLHNEEFTIMEVSYKKRKKSEVDHASKSYAIKEKMDEYEEASSFGKHTLNNLKDIKHRIMEDEKRSYIVEAVEKWLRKNPHFPGERCDEELIEPDCFICGSADGTKGGINKVAGTTETPTPSNSSDNDGKELITVYIRWGKKSCSNEENTTTLYRGFMASTSNMRGSSGAYYLCLPETPRYSKNTNQDIEESTYIYNTLLDVSGYHDSMMTNTSAPGFHQAFCSLCQVMHRSNVIIVPGTIQCPPGWTYEYLGYVMGQKVGKKRTQFTCVDRKPEMKEKAIKSIPVLSLLNFVETECTAIPCMTTGYVKYAEMPCVVCSK